MTLTKPTLLILTDWYLPGFKAGGPIQSIRNLVDALQDDFEIYIYTSDRDLGDALPYDGVVVDQWNQLPGCKVFYSSKGQRSISAYKKLLLALEPDTVYLNSLFSIEFTLLPIYALRRSFNGRIVLAPRGMLHSGALKIKAFKKNLFLRAIRMTGFFSRLVIHATDTQEWEDVRKHLPGARRIDLIPNFPSFREFHCQRIAKEPGTARLIYLARIASNKNLSFILEVFRDYPVKGQLQLTIAGEVQDDSYWQYCRQLIQALPANLEVVIRGAIPNPDVLAELQNHHLYVLPTQGENFGHGIFEALLAGKPVLISDQTPWRNLDSKGIGWDIPLSHPEAFKEAVEKIVAMAQEVYDQTSAACHQFAMDYRSKNETKRNYIKMFTE